MVGGGSRRDDVPLGVSSNNVFAALDSLRKKKKSDSSKSKASAKNQPKESEPQVFWAPTPLTAKSWADVDDDDDDDYYATTAPPQPVWGSSEQQTKEGSAVVEEETESDDDGLDEVDDDVEEEPEHEHEVQLVPVDPARKAQSTLAPKDPERQLSKKELKKKELAELDAVLAELGISPKDNNDAGQNGKLGVVEEKKSETNGDTEENPLAPSESKTSKKKKKKDKSSDVKDLQGKPEFPNNNGTDKASMEPAKEDDASTVDVKERLKKMASMKKKKSGKEVDVAAKGAAVEAAARSAKLAAAKKKEKSHYNQQPVR
uniref:Uncharacterized protein n=1 Tax=Anthurium amnicola TaxID=1678845 RepID=A0A1D1YSR9_9ARAE